VVYALVMAVIYNGSNYWRDDVVKGIIMSIMFVVMIVVVMSMMITVTMTISVVFIMSRMIMVD